MTEDDWIVEIDDFLRASNESLSNWVKIGDFKGIWYVDSKEIWKFFNEIKMPVSMQDQIIEQIWVDDMDGKTALVSYWSLENSLAKWEFLPEFEKELDANTKNDEIMEGIWRFMFLN